VEEKGEEAEDDAGGFVAAGAEAERAEGAEGAERAADAEDAAAEIGSSAVRIGSRCAASGRGRRSVPPCVAPAVAADRVAGARCGASVTGVSAGTTIRGIAGVFALVAGRSEALAAACAAGRPRS
jgi:hypothetical protein